MTEGLPPADCFFGGLFISLHEMITYRGVQVFLAVQGRGNASRTTLCSHSSKRQGNDSVVISLQAAATAGNGESSAPAAFSVSAATAAAPAPMPIKDDTLPEGWSSAIDPTYSHVYYFNVSTGQRTWEKPAAAPKAAPVAPAVQVGVLCKGCSCCASLRLFASR